MTDTLKNLISGLTDQVGLVDFYLEEAKTLPKKDCVFSICDLDDTIFARADQLACEPELVKRRGYEWNTYMINEIGLHNMIQKYYQWKTYPKEIIEKNTPENTLILTAGIPEYQELKSRALKLTHFPMQVVWEWKDKILATIRYVIFELKYIPSEIIVYEDRPQYFVEYRELIEWVLGTKLTIMFVEMNGNIWYNKIEEMN